MKRITVSIAVFALLLTTAVTGCAKKEDFALKVNDKVIPRQAYEEKMTAVKNYLTDQGMDLNSEQGKASMESVKNDVLENLIGAELVRQEVENNKWDTEDPEVKKQVEELKAQIPDYQKWLEEQAMTEAEVAQHFAFTSNVSKETTVSEQEIKQFFEANYARYGGQNEQVRARHILLETEEEAQKVIEELKAGADFAELAKQKSIEPAAKTTGGDLNYFSRGEMIAEFEQAAFSQEKGVISEKPVKTSFGYHVILVEDRKQAVVPDFEKAKDAVTTDTLEYAQNMKIQSYYNEIRTKAKIEYASDIKPKNA